MRIVLTNDDGIEAPGLRALERVVDGAITVAPDCCHSGCGHRVTTDSAIAVAELDPGRFRVTGTPADCARLALRCLAPEADWLISGINRGGNLGTDIYMSGTVAAAREAALLGCPAIAISQYVARGRELDWDLAARRARIVLERLFALGCDEGSFWNVNLAHPSDDGDELPIVFCPADARPMDVRFRKDESGYVYVGDYQARPRNTGGDVAECFAGKITVTRLHVAHAAEADILR
jgi:5'-nucleotidase